MAAHLDPKTVALLNRIKQGKRANGASYYSLQGSQAHGISHRWNGTSHSLRPSSGISNGRPQSAGYGQRQGRSSSHSTRPSRLMSAGGYGSGQHGHTSVSGSSRGQRWRRPASAGRIGSYSGQNSRYVRGGPRDMGVMGRNAITRGQGGSSSHQRVALTSSLAQQQQKQQQTRNFHIQQQKKQDHLSQQHHHHQHFQSMQLQQPMPPSRQSKDGPPQPPQTSSKGLSHNQPRMSTGKESSGVRNVRDSVHGCIFTESASKPGVPIVYRTANQRAQNSERLNLDRAGLTRIPILEGEHRLRLLNYQNNSIGSIEHLTGLPNLIFLDLYNNRIKSIDNLGTIPTLRVLMLGKNLITEISNLEPLVKLDVLDLHSNSIEVIDGIQHLRELRVLNLAGNKIRSVVHIEGLHSLTELNLRRNCIAEVSELDKLPALGRLFLSNNQIRSFDRISCIFNSTSLSEVALDANPLCETLSSPAAYRARLIDGIRTLKNLDLKRVTDDERNQAKQVLAGEIEHSQTHGAGRTRSARDSSHQSSKGDDENHAKEGGAAPEDRGRKMSTASAKATSSSNKRSSRVWQRLKKLRGDGSSAMRDAPQLRGEKFRRCFLCFRIFFWFAEEVQQCCQRRCKGNSVFSWPAPRPPGRTRRNSVALEHGDSERRCWRRSYKETLYLWACMGNS